MTGLSQQLSIVRHASADFSFSVGQKFRHAETIFEIAERREGFCILQDLTTLDRRYIETDRLYQQYLERAIVPFEDNDKDVLIKAVSNLSEQIPADLIHLSDAALTHGLAAIRFIKALRDLGYKSLRPTPLLKLEYERLKRQFSLEEETALSSNISLATIYRRSVLIDAAGGDWRAAFPRFSRRGGRGIDRIGEEALSHLKEIWTLLRQDSRASIHFSRIDQELRRRLRAALGEHKMFESMPSRSTIARLTKKEFGAYAICVRNKGRQFADKQFRDWFPRDRATSPLQVVEFDDKDSRIFLIDDQIGLPYGRAYVTAGVDQYSSVPPGMSIGDRPRSTLSALDAFRRVLLPKTLCHEFSMLSSPPEFFGTPSITLFDNAPYNHAINVQRSIQEASGSILVWAKPYTPTEKSVVEDFNGHMTQGIFELLPGYGGPKFTRERLSEGLAGATMSLQVFVQVLNKWAYDVYCNTPRADGFTPRQLWHAGMHGCVERLPKNLDRFDAIFALEHSVKLRPNGVQFCLLSYQNEKLLELRRHIGSTARIIFRYHPQNLSRIYVLDPRTNGYFVVPSTAPEYTQGLTLAQHKWIRKLARDRGITNPALPQLFEAREALRVLTAQTRLSRKRIERRWANSIGELSAPSAAPAPENSEPDEAITELEYQLEQISQIELPPIDESDWDLPEDF